MPTIRRFLGIDILMYYNDHSPPHFHAEYGDDEEVYEIRTLEFNVANYHVALTRRWQSGQRSIALNSWQTGSVPGSKLLSQILSRSIDEQENERWNA